MRSSFLLGKRNDHPLDVIGDEISLEIQAAAVLQCNHHAKPMGWLQEIHSAVSRMGVVQFHVVDTWLMVTMSECAIIYIVSTDCIRVIF